MSTPRLNFEAEARETMRIAREQGWARGGDGQSFADHHHFRKDQPIARTAASRACWQVAGTLAEPFTVRDLYAAALAIEPEVTYSAVKSWIGSRHAQGHVIFVGRLDTGEKSGAKAAILLSQYKRCEDFQGPPPAA